VPGAFTSLLAKIGDEADRKYLIDGRVLAIPIDIER
jgi:hypothetical protein